MIKDGKFPNTHILTGEFFMMMGFFLIFLIEELVHGYIHSYQEKKEREKAQDKSEKGHLELNMDNAFMRGIDVRNSAVKRFSESRNGSLSMPSDEHRNSVSIVDHLQHAGHGHSHLGVVPKGDEDDLLASSMRGLLIVLALSIHELFEGFAVGLERDPKGVYFMFAAVSAHKYVISFCIGVELMVQQTKVWLAFVYVVIYSAVSAIGKSKNYRRVTRSLCLLFFVNIKLTVFSIVQALAWERCSRVSPQGMPRILTCPMSYCKESPRVRYCMWCSLKC